jgi:hypothetical protein
MVPPNHDVDRDRRVHHRGTSAGDEADLQRASAMVEASNPAAAPIAIDPAFNTSCAVSTLSTFFSPEHCRGLVLMSPCIWPNNNGPSKILVLC